MCHKTEKQGSQLSIWQNSRHSKAYETLKTDKANQIAKEKGFKKIIIGTGDAGIKQLYLYQKVGFEIYDIKHRFFIDNYPEPIYENGIQLKHMIMLKKDLK